MSLTDEDKKWISEMVAAQIELLHAKIERVETALLTEFHNWASPVEMRVRSHTAALRAVDLEVEAISDRVTKLEGGKEN